MNTPVDGPTDPQLEAWLDDLIRSRLRGMSLAAPFYTSPAVFDLDIAEIFSKQWIFVATEPEIAEPGDFVTVSIGRYSVIITRDDDEQVAAFHNVCRHRGARILAEESGSVGNIVCSYHQWTYGMDGALLYAEGQPPTFDKSCFSLRRVNVRSIAGLIYICLADEPPADIAEVDAIVGPYLEPHGLRKAKVAKQVDLVEQGNWKLTMENNRECYHCSVGHPELLNTFFPTWGYSDSEAIPTRLRPIFDRFNAAMVEHSAVWDRFGLPHQRVAQLDTRPTGFHIEREPMDLAGESFTLDGTVASTKLLTEMPVTRLGRLSMHSQPNLWLHITSDHAVTFSVLPVGPDRTRVRTTWLVHEDAEEGVDYDLDRLTSVWEITNQQDANFVELAQEGISSPAYVPGPYAPSEFQVEAFVNWYVGRLKSNRGIPDDHLSVVQEAG